MRAIRLALALLVLGGCTQGQEHPCADAPLRGWLMVDGYQEQKWMGATVMTLYCYQQQKDPVPEYYLGS